MLEVKFESSIEVLAEENAHWKWWLYTTGEILHLQPEDFNENELTDRNETICCGRMDENDPREIRDMWPAPQIASHYGNSKIFQDIESSEDEMLEADPNIERSMAIVEALGKMLTLS